MAGSVYWYWHFNGPRSEGLILLRKASRAKSDAPRDKQSKMWAMEGLSMFAANAGHLDEAIEADLELQALAQDLGDILGESAAWPFLATSPWHKGITTAQTRLPDGRSKCASNQAKVGRSP